MTPAGKSMRRLSLLSGGEKSLVALAFVFAVLLARPCPFYILDEVEAALDDINLDRFLRLVRRFAERSQFVVVTHQKRTMDAADVLYGVSMGGDGMTKVVSRKLPRDQEEAPSEHDAAVPRRTPGRRAGRRRRDRPGRLAAGPLACRRTGPGRIRSRRGGAGRRSERRPGGSRGVLRAAARGSLAQPPGAHR